MGDLLRADGFHAAEIDRTFAEKTGAAFDVMSQNNMPVAEWSGQARFGRAKNCDHRHAQQRGKMHRARVVGKQQTALTQLADKLIERGLADAVHAMVADRRGNPFAYCRIVLCPEQNPLGR